MSRFKVPASLIQGNMRSRRRQYLLLLLGVTLAVMFLCSSLLILQSMAATRREDQNNAFGLQDVMLFGVAAETGARLCQEGLLSSAVEMETIADIMANAQAVDSPYANLENVSVARYDPQWAHMLRCRILEGRMPENPGEIALETRALSILRQSCSVGDTLTVDLRIPNGSDSFLAQRTQATFTVTGVYTSAMSSYDSVYKSRCPFWLFPLATVSADEPLTPGGRTCLNLLGEYSGSIDDDGFSQGYQRLALPLLSGVPPMATRSMIALESPLGDQHSMAETAGLFALLAFAALLAIGNAQLAMLESRKQQIGLLRAIGATRRQIRILLLQETGIIALCAVILGTGLAILLSSALCRLMGDQVVFPFKALSLLAIALACALCVMLTALAPLLRVQRITPMQAIRDIDRIRAIGRMKRKSRPSFSPPALLARRNLRSRRFAAAAIMLLVAIALPIFGLCAVQISTAWRGYQNQGANQWDFSLSTYALQDNWSMDFRINLNYASPMPDEQDIASILALPGVDRVSGNKRLTVHILTDHVTEYATAEGWSSWFTYLSDQIPAFIRYTLSFPEYADQSLSDYINGYTFGHASYLRQKEHLGYTQQALCVSIYALPPAQLDKLAPYLYKGTIDQSALDSGQQVLLSAPDKYAIDYPEPDGMGISYGGYQIFDGFERADSSVFTNDMFHVGDRLTLSMAYSAQSPWIQNESDRKINELPSDAATRQASPVIGGLIEIANVDLGREDLPGIDHLTVITSLQGLDALGFGDVGYEQLNIGLSGSPSDEQLAYLTQQLEFIAARFPQATIDSMLELAQITRSTLARTLGFSLVMGILLSTFILLLLHNTLTGQIRSHARQIGLMRAVGANPGQISQIYLRQIALLFLGGMAAGAALLAGFFQLPRLMKAENLSITFTSAIWKIGSWLNLGMGTSAESLTIIFVLSLGYGLLLALIGLLLVRGQLTRILRRPILENIRVL